MPYKVPGVPGTWYEPGTRKGIRDIESPRGSTDSSNPAGVKPSSTGTPDNRTGDRTALPGDKSPKENYTVAQGDTLAKIASTKYGDEKLWTEIKKANPGIEAIEHALATVRREDETNFSSVKLVNANAAHHSAESDRRPPKKAADSQSAPMGA